MDSRHLVDPELLGVIDAMPAFVIDANNLQFVRQAFAIPNVASAEAMSEVEMVEHSAPGWNGDPEVGLCVYRPIARTAPLPCILHLHGGGYVAGDARSHEPVHRELALALNCAIVSVNYRLAPETPFPGAVHGGYAAVAWLWSVADTLGVDRDRIAVSGESAGGGLAAALAILVRDRGEYRFCFQHLTYPMLDDRTCHRGDLNPYAGEFIWPRDSNRFGWRSLLGAEPGRPDVSPYAAAARAGDLSGLPPTYIVVGALDLFVDEDIDFAQRLIRAGVPTELHVLPGAYHGYGFSPLATVTITSQQASLAAFAKALA